MRYFYTPFDTATVIEVLLWEMAEDDPGRPILLNALSYLMEPVMFNRYRLLANFSTVEKYLRKTEDVCAQTSA